MGFYLRKSFRMGPLRLNLSKSGLGASFGVTGARLGITSSGRTYVHAGRGGLYMRESIGGAAHGGTAHRPAAQRARRETITLYEDTGVTYAPAADRPDQAVAARPTVAPETRSGWRYLLLPLGGAILVAGSVGEAGGVSHPVVFALGLLALLAGPVPIWRAWRRSRARSALRRALEPAVVAGRPLTDAESATAQAALRDPHLTDAARAAVLERSYLDAARKIMDDGYLTPEELRLLEQLETAFPVDRPFCRGARADAFRGVYLRAVADHELSAEEERELEEVRDALRVAADDIATELDVIRRLAELRRIPRGELPVVEPDRPLPRGEVCHFQGPGRLLKERNLRTFQRDGQKYRVRGLTIDREGTVFVTNRRVLLVHYGTTSVPMDRILDVDVDVDRNVIRITKDGAKRPVLLTTPDSVRAAAIIAAVRGM